MRFLATGDIHERATCPENRIGNFIEDMRLKREEIRSIAEKYNVSAILEPGDLWDTPNPPLDFASEVLKQWLGVDVSEQIEAIRKQSNELGAQSIELAGLLNEFSTGNLSESDLKKKIDGLKAKTDKISTSIQKGNAEISIPLVGVVGNHELYGNNIVTLPKTFTGFMDKLGLIRLVSKENPLIFKTEEGYTVAITGTNYHLDIDKPEHIDDYIVEKKLGDIHIHIVHGFLSSKNKGKLIRHTLIDNIKDTKADLTIAGHDHLGFKLTEINGKYFVNVGAVPRLSNDLKEIDRRPKVLLIETTKDAKLEMKEIYLKSAKKGELVLSRTKIEQNKAEEVKIEEFKKVVREASEKKSTDINEIVKELSNNKKLPPKITENVVNLISEKMEEIKGKHSVSQNRAYISKLILENFQSHEFTEIELDKQFNVLVGESRQGKTSIIRACRLLYENRPRGKRIIRNGAEYLRVTAIMSNGYIVERYIERKDSGKNGYYITDPSTGNREFFNTKILPEVQKILGYSTLFVDKDLELNLNFMLQGESWFLIGDNVSSNQRAKIIGAIYGTQYVDSVIRDHDKDIKRLKEKERYLLSETEKIDKEISNYSHLNDLKATIEKLEEGILEIKTKQSEQAKIKGLYDKKLETLQQKEENHKIITMCTNHEYIERELTEIQGIVNNYEKVNELVVNRYDLTNKLDKLKRAINETNNNVEAEQLIDEIKGIVEKSNSLKSLFKKKEILLSQKNEEDKIISETKDIDKATPLIEECRGLIEKASGLERIKTLSESKGKVLKSYNAILSAMQCTEHIFDANQGLTEIIQLLANREKLETLIKERELISSNMAMEKERAIEAEAQMKGQLDKYKELLVGAGKCPTCFGTINKATVNRIVEEYTKNEEEESNERKRA